jgi:HSP20 family molecular chaperone IbpA
MAKDSRSFFERLTGTVRMDDSPDADRSASQKGAGAKKQILAKDDTLAGVWNDQETEAEGELTVDVYQTADSIVIKSMIAGVKPEDLDISITRDSVTIRGHREEEKIAKEDDYFARELYWGSFSRIIQLPEEIDVDEADAIDKHGLLILKLPKLDKRKQSKLKVKLG